MSMHLYFLQSSCGDQLKDPDSDSATRTTAQRAHGGVGAFATDKCKLRDYVLP